MVLLSSFSLSVAALPAPLVGSVLAAGTRHHADTVFHNGSIYSLNDKNQKYQAMAVRDGRISYLGKESCIKPFIGPNTAVFDLEGRMVMPGLVDSHMHTIMGGRFLLTCSFNFQPLNLEQALAHIKECLDAEPERTGDHDWLEVVAMDWYSLIEKTGRPLTTADLDSLNTNRPLVLHSRDQHSHLVNKNALKVSGIDASTPNPAGGVIERLPSSDEPSGVLQDNAVFLLSGPPEPTFADDVQAANAALRLLREAGVTTFQDAASGAAHGEIFAAVKKEGHLTARAYFDLVAPIPESVSAIAPGVASIVNITSTFHDPSEVARKPTIKFQAVKLLMDGVVIYPANTGALLDPYLKESEDGTWVPDPNSIVKPYWSLEILSEFFRQLLPKKIDAQLHVDGDAAVRTTLDAIEIYRKETGNTDYRLGLAHCEIVKPSDWPRFPELNAIPIISYQWAQASSTWMPNGLNAIGPERVPLLEAWGDLARTGSKIAFGSDWPIDPLDEWLAIKVALTRSGDATNPNSPAARDPQFDIPGLPGLTLTRDQALRSITTEGAKFLRADKHIGSLEVGKLADVIVLRDNYYELPLEHVARQKNLLTMVGGEVLYIADEVDFKNGVKAKYPNDDDLGKKMTKKTYGGIQGRDLSPEGVQIFRRMAVRNKCVHDHMH